MNKAIKEASPHLGYNWNVTNHSPFLIVTVMFASTAWQSRTEEWCDLNFHLQTFLVWQILLSIVFLGRRYNVNQIIGCLLVSLGVIITVARWVAVLLPFKYNLFGNVFELYECHNLWEFPFTRLNSDCNKIDDKSDWLQSWAARF